MPLLLNNLDDQGDTSRSRAQADEGRSAVAEIYHIETRPYHELQGWLLDIYPTRSIDWVKPQLFDWRKMKKRNTSHEFNLLDRGGKTERYTELRIPCAIEGIVQHPQVSELGDGTTDLFVVVGSGREESKILDLGEDPQKTGDGF